MSSVDTTRAVVVIPAYEPTSKLIELIEDLSRDGRRIMVFDDGSGSAFRGIFERVAALPNTMVLRNEVNVGKGGTLKAAFNLVLQQMPPDSVGAVTADADGQHLPTDIRRIAECLERGGPTVGTLILGSRTFARSVPLRNRFGNVLTRRVFRMVTGRELADTQTGLRGIPRTFLPALTQLRSGRYEFELEMLVVASRTMAIEEVPIATVYGDFAKSHFNPLRDSLRIYAALLRLVVRG